MYQNLKLKSILKVKTNVLLQYITESNSEILNSSDTEVSSSDDDEEQKLLNDDDPYFEIANQHFGLITNERCVNRSDQDLMNNAFPLFMNLQFIGEQLIQHQHLESTTGKLSREEWLILLQYDKNKRSTTEMINNNELMEVKSYKDYTQEEKQQLRTVQRKNRQEKLQSSRVLRRMHQLGIRFKDLATLLPAYDYTDDIATKLKREQEEIEYHLKTESILKSFLQSERAIFLYGGGQLLLKMIM
jgi:hypothetical protein